jgi:gluconate kinase
MIIIVFGLAGAGKTYVGKLINKHFDFHHEDADDYLSQEMEEFIENKKSFTIEMLDNFMDIIIDKINLLKTKHENIVISQAFYRNANRERLAKQFAQDELLFLQVETNDSIITNRLKDRSDGIDLEYAASIRKYFEPMNKMKIIYNDVPGEDKIISQLKEILQ